MLPKWLVMVKTETCQRMRVLTAHGALLSLFICCLLYDMLPPSSKPALRHWLRSYLQTRCIKPRIVSALNCIFNHTIKYQLLYNPGYYWHWLQHANRQSTAYENKYWTCQVDSNYKSNTLHICIASRQWKKCSQRNCILKNMTSHTHTKAFYDSLPSILESADAIHPPTNTKMTSQCQYHAVSTL